ncbi:MAG: hypothetical protein ACE367_13550 [Acidimicrobiales bacterium]
MPADDTDADGSSLWSSLADLVVYAPIGLTLDAQDLAPDLARRGRQHTAAARRIGEFAVKAGMRRLDELVTALDPSRSESTPGTADTNVAPATGVAEAVVARSDTAVAAAEDGQPLDTARTAATDQPLDEAPPALDEEPPSGEAVELAIPDYDLLAASQVVKRLDGLDPDQLDAIRRHEESGRGRRTILHKITRLQAG